MHGWQANKKGTCAPPVEGRAMPENEIPPVIRGDIYLMKIKLVTCAVIPLLYKKRIRWWMVRERAALRRTR